MQPEQVFIEHSPAISSHRQPTTRRVYKEQSVSQQRRFDSELLLAQLKNGNWCASGESRHLCVKRNRNKVIPMVDK